MNIYDTLNPPQREAVLHTDGPLLILAGAGSGKTRVLTHRIAYLIAEQGVHPWNILAITFTNKAAGEMRQRVDALVGMGSESIWVSTFHSCCVRILRRHIDNLGYSNNFVIYDGDDQKSLMKEIFRRLRVDTKIYKERGMLSRISHAKDEMLTPEDIEKEAHGDREDLLTAQIYREYQAALKANNALDFDDLLVLTVELFEQFPEILEYYQERFRYIMVDEYQDTNNVQFRFVSLLAARYRNLCVVGDDDQSIYKFRGANIRNILEFEDTYPDAVVIRLEQNYRSTGTILAAANEVISNNKERKKKKLWTEKGDGSKIHFRQFLNGFEEAEYVVGEIQAACRDSGISYKDFAVLYRTNAQSRLFEEKLLMAGMPYKIVGGINFYARREIKDLLCYLRTIANGNDDLSVSRIINVPRRGIGTTTLARVQDYAASHGLSLYAALEQAKEIPGIGRGLSKLEDFVRFIRVLRTKAEAEDMTVRGILQEVIDSTGYVKELEAEETEEAQTRIENIDELISTAQSYQDAREEAGQAPTLAGFLEEVALVSDVDTVDADQDYILLMTLHSAKGLEFPRVFMVGMEDGLFPGYATITYGSREDLEEERRLCYVGITRAMEELTLTCSRSRMIRGEVMSQDISRFVQEIPRELIDLGYERRTSPAERLREMKEAQKLSGPLSQAFGTAAPVSAGSTWSARNIGTYQTAAMTKGPAAKADHLDYGVGDTVRHIKFGVGVVQEIKEGGRDYEVTVEFDRYGVKKMFAGFARLVKV